MGVTRRLLTAVLTLALGGASVPGSGVAASPVRPLTGVRTWVVYYGAAPEAARELARFDVVVLEYLTFATQPMSNSDPLAQSG